MINKFTIETVNNQIRFCKTELLGRHKNASISVIQKIDFELMYWKTIKRILLHANRN